MSINAKMVSELRDKTNATMDVCKRALVRTNGDMSEAEEEIRVNYKSLVVNSELEQLRQRVAEQLETIKALNSCIGGEGSTTTENLIRVSRLEQRVAELENEAKQLRDLQYELMRSGALVAIEKCKNATGQRRVIDMYVSANQIAEDLLNAMDSGA